MLVRMANAPFTTVRFLTPPVIARRLGVNTRKVYRYIDTGELRAFDTSERKGEGKPRWKIDPADLAQFLAARSNATTTSTPPTATRSARRRAGRKYL